MARLLIVGGGCRGRRLAAELVADGHAVRIATRNESHRAAIESAGAECVVACPDRLGTLRSALDTVTVVSWLLATARGPREQLQALHGSRLERFLHQLIDTTVRGFVFEAPSSAGPADVASRTAPAGAPDADAVVGSAELAHGRLLAHTLTQRHAIPLAVIEADPRDLDAWLSDARAAVGSLLGVRAPQSAPDPRSTA